MKKTTHYIVLTALIIINGYLATYLSYSAITIQNAPIVLRVAVLIIALFFYTLIALSMIIIREVKNKK